MVLLYAAALLFLAKFVNGIITVAKIAELKLTALRVISCLI